jgi:hypothetical protein
VSALPPKADTKAIARRASRGPEAVAPNQLTSTGSADERVHKDREFAALVSVGISDPTQPGEAELSAPSSQAISD